MTQQSYKKFVASAATATLVASALIPVASANVTTSAFTDVPASYQKAVDFVVSNNISSGLTPTQYGVSQQIKRVDAAVMIAAAAGLNDKDAVASGFKDVPARAAVAVNSLKAAGVVNGKSATNFGSQDNITRGEAALMLQKAFKLKAGDTKNSFTDVKDSYDAAVDALVANKVTNGINATQFGTGNPIKRGDFAKFLFALEDQIVVGVAVEKVTVVNETTTTAKLKDAKKDLTAADFKVLVNGTAVTPTSVVSDAKGEVYTITHASLKDTKGVISVNGKQADFDFVVVEPKVESVKAINAKQVEVKFSTPVDEASVLAPAGTLKVGVFVFKSLETPAKTINADSAKGVLSEDGKTLTVKAATTELFEGRYDVTVDGAKDEKGNVIDKYVAKNVDFGKDTVAPTITATERISSNQVKVKFSEPVVFTTGALSAKYTDTTLNLVDSKITVGGTALGSVASTASAPVSELVLNLSDADVKVDKDIAVKFNGVADTAGNLISPQPAEITVVKKQADGIEPTISTVTQTGAKKFAIKFAKDLDGNIAAADVTVGGVATSTVKKVSASEYEFTTTANLKGLQTVEVAANKAVDLAGQKNTAALSKLVTFTEDATAPKATSKLVVGKDNKEYIELTFDKDVTAGAVTVAGSQVKDYITSTPFSETVTAVYADRTGDNKKVLHVPLTASTLSVEGAVYDLTVSSAAVTSIAGVKMTDTTAKFTRGTDGASANTNIVSNVVVAQVANNNTVTATFTIPTGSKLDGTTATNVANYVIAGAEVESVSLAAASGTTQVATLKLKEGSNTFTGVRNITVKDVKVAGSTKVMEPKTVNNVSLKENVRPTVTKSEVTKVTQSTTGSALVPAVNATVSNAQLVTTGVATGTPVVTLNSATYNTGASKAAVNGVELEYDGTVWKSNTAAVADSAITSVSGVTGAVAGDKVTFNLSAYTAEVPAVPATTGSTDVLLTFSEAVVPGSAVDFELFIDNTKVTATVATSAVTDTKTLKVTIDKALTTENFAKGVQLKAATTLDIADTAGNLLKLDTPISLKLN